MSKTDFFQIKKFDNREEERIIKSTLSEISKYDENTKISQKIYNFQNLARTSMTESQFQDDDRYVKLFSSIKKDINELSPAQITACCIACASLKIRDMNIWKKLSNKLIHNFNNFFYKIKNLKIKSSPIDKSQTCLALHYISKSNSKYIYKNIYEICPKLLSPSTGLCNEYDLTHFYYILRKCNYKNEKIIKFIQDLYHYTYNAHISYKGCIYILYNISIIKKYDINLINKLLKPIKNNINNLSEQEISNISLSLARFNIRHTIIFNKISTAVSLSVSKNPNNVSARALSIIFYSFSKVAIRDKAMLECIKQKLKTSPETFNNLCIMQVIYGLGRAGIRDPEAWNSVISIIDGKLKKQPPAHLSSIGWALGRVGLLYEEIHNQICDAALEKGDIFTAKQIIDLLDGFVLAGFYRYDIFEDFLKRLITSNEKVTRIRQAQLSRIMFSIALEFPEFVRETPKSLHILLERYQNPFQLVLERIFHRTLRLCFEHLSLDFELLKQKGPYTFDAKIKLNEKDSKRIGFRRIGLDLVSEASICIFTNELLGLGRLKQRHTELMGWKPVHIRRNTWLNLKTLNEKRDCLVEALGPMVTVIPLVFPEDAELIQKNADSIDSNLLIEQIQSELNPTDDTKNIPMLGYNESWDPKTKKFYFSSKKRVFLTDKTENEDIDNRNDSDGDIPMKIGIAVPRGLKDKVKMNQESGQ
eukprot:GHVL01019465.1.p1 GENE.GHVL01019465.1~~GHVL01019465.1.p1  ORF type:complete len:702 (+),score=160.29 GHVL01019465.1:48-2153(+)